MGLPDDAIPFSQRLLYWHGVQLRITAPSAKRGFSVEDTDPLLDSAGAEHARYKTFGQYKDEVLLRSTEELYQIDPAQAMGRTLPEFHAPGRAVTAEWQHSHTLDVSADGVYIRVDDQVKIERITIIGYMRWERKIEQPDFRVIRRVRDGEPFAGALISLGQREGQMFAFVISNDRTAGIHFVQLEERHRNMIRQISLQLPPQPETPES